MSNNVQLLRDNAAFLKLFLNTSKEQRYALLASSSLEQLDVLREIFTNLKKLPLSDTEKKFISRRSKLIDRLTDFANLNITERRELYWESRERLIKLILPFKQKLIGLL